MARDPLNPYGELGTRWLRGSFHGHCSEHSGCSSVPLTDSLRRHRELGADFAAYTDHDHVTDLGAARAAHPGLILLEGFEYSSAQNLLFLGPYVPPLHRLGMADAMAAAVDLLTIVAHPTPRPPEVYWSRKLLESLPRLPDGVEVYNGHYGVLRKTEKGSTPRYETFWDEVLNAGLRLWGFANDDSHDPEDFGNAWNMVNAPATAAGVVEAARRGRHYGTTGLLATTIRGDGAYLEVGFDHDVTGRFVGPGGRTLSAATGRVFRHTLGAESYARFEAHSGAGRIWLQPVMGKRG